jgi:hypothetical protein
MGKVMAYKVLVGKPEALGTPRHSWDNKIKMGLKESEATCTVFTWFTAGISGKLL